MNRDIYVVEGKDLQLGPADLYRAANVLSIQIGSLEYEPDFGVDVKYFLESEFEIQTVSFQSYLVQRLLEHQIPVLTVVKVVEQFVQRLTFNIGDSSSGTELIR